MLLEFDRGADTARRRSITFGLLMGIFLFWTCLKYHWLKMAVGPTVLGDELLYRLYAQRLLEFKPYLVCAYFKSLGGRITDPVYPPVYPLLLAIASTMSKLHPIQSMKIANILFSTLVIFPVYGITRILTGRVAALGAALVAGAIPIEFAFPAAMMSENISVTLLLTLFYLALRPVKCKAFSAGLFGLCLAANYLTKFSFLPMAPFPVLLMLVRQWQLHRDIENPYLRAKKLSRPAVVAVISFLIPVSIWIGYIVHSGIPFLYGFGMQPGFVNANAPLSVSYKLLLIFTILQLAGILISTLPIFLPAALSFYMLRIRNSGRKSDSMYFIAVFGFVTFMWLFISYYVWNAAYLYGPTIGLTEVRLDNFPLQIGDRYLAANFFLLLPIAFTVLEFLSSRRHSKRFYGLLSIVSILFVVFTYYASRALYQRVPWPIPVGVIFSWPATPNLSFGANCIPMVWIALAVTAAIALVSIASHFRYKFGHQAVISFTFLLTALLIYEGRLAANFAWDNKYAQNLGKLGEQISQTFDSNHLADISRSDDHGIFITLSDSASRELSRQLGTSPTDENWSYNLSYWTGRIVYVNSPQAGESKENHFLMTDHPETGETIARYQLNGHLFSLQNTQ